MVAAWGFERLVLVTQRATLDESLAMHYLQSLEARSAERGVVLSVIYEAMDLVNQRLVVLRTDAGTAAVSTEWGLHLHV